jgi:hypothetical protein
MAVPFRYIFEINIDTHQRLAIGVIGYISADNSMHIIGDENLTKKSVLKPFVNSIFFIRKALNYY